MPARASTTTSQPAKQLTIREKIKKSSYDNNNNNNFPETNAATYS